MELIRLEDDQCVILRASADELYNVGSAMGETLSLLFHHDTQAAVGVSDDELLRVIRALRRSRRLLNPDAPVRPPNYVYEPPEQVTVEFCEVHESGDALVRIADEGLSVMSRALSVMCDRHDNDDEIRYRTGVTRQAALDLIATLNRCAALVATHRAARN